MFGGNSSIWCKRFPNRSHERRFSATAKIRLPTGLLGDLQSRIILVSLPEE